MYIFNFHGNDSLSDFEIGTNWKSDHFILYESDEHRFDGNQRLNDAHGKWFTPINKKTMGRPYTLKVYLPCRVCIVMCTYECAKTKTFPIPEMPAVCGDHLHDECEEVK